MLDWLRERRREVSPGNWASLLLAQGILCFVIGQAFWTYYTWALHREVPTPSWADVAFLAAYPCMLAGILALPARTLSPIDRTRLLIDGSVIMTAVVTFSWYFLLGPILLSSHTPFWGTCATVAYPLADLILVFCLIAFAIRAKEQVRAHALLLLAGLCIIIVTDTIFAYQVLKGTYQQATILDLGWPLGYMLVGLGACRIRAILPQEAGNSSPAEAVPAAGAMTLWKFFLPYTLVPAVCLLIFYTMQRSGDERYEPGVYIGATVLVALLLFRQGIAILENRRLNHSLGEACRALETQNQQTRAYAEHLQQSNLELQELRQALEVNQAELEREHRALSATNAKLAHANEQLVELNVQLTQQAATDGLTGLSNHRAFQERLKDETYRCERYGNPLSLLLLDVDRFKQYNDAFGHPAGDAVLRQVADVLKSTLRHSDLPARYGGEEFAVLLSETEAEAALLTAEKIRLAMETAHWPHREVTVSVGVATLTEGMIAADLVSAADQALYRSKQDGRNRCTHIRDICVEFDFASGNSQPYTRTMQEMLNMQQAELFSASERVKEALITAYDLTIESWAKLLDMRDKETEGHSVRVTYLTVQIARSVGMNQEEIQYARWGALLHDIGKMGVPDHILLKPDVLTADEWVVMRRHPVIAYEMLSPISFLRPALDIPYCHHEKWDGSGYPQGLKGEEIPLAARLFAVIDVWDALTNDRPYRKAWDRERVLAYLQENAGTHFDPRAVRAFIALIDKLELPRAA